MVSMVLFLWVLRGLRYGYVKGGAEDGDCLGGREYSGEIREIESMRCG